MYKFMFYQVRDVMTTEPVTVNQQATLAEVEAIFEEHDFNGLPVVDGSNLFTGIITKLDLLKSFVFTKTFKIPPYEDIMAQKVSRVMNRTIRAVCSETPLTRVLNKMIETGYKSFPVVEDDHLIGIVAREDVLRALRQASEGMLPARPASAANDELSRASKISGREGREGNAFRLD